MWGSVSVVHEEMQKGRREWREGVWARRPRVQLLLPV